MGTLHSIKKIDGHIFLGPSGRHKVLRSSEEVVNKAQQRRVERWTKKANNLAKSAAGKSK